ncbi:MAG: hypothetical protein N3A01_09850 [Bacteroidales bacterium]|nr:hypothetical protein [Bacteroidales bacterium]
MKYILSFIFFNFLLLPSFSQEEVYVDINIPQRVNAGQKYNIDIIVYKGNITGFAKLELFIPMGVKINIINSQNATVIQNLQVIKLIWVDLPYETKFSIKGVLELDYRLKGYKEIFGNFYYVYQKNRMQSSVGIIPFQVLNDKDYTYLPKQTEEYPKIEPKKVIKPVKLNKPDFFRVQIGAFTRKLNKHILKELYPDVEFIFEEIIDNLYKYTIGDFETYQSAYEFAINCGIKDAFVVEYVNYKRK